jgi:hypothetical protein
LFLLLERSGALAERSGKRKRNDTTIFQNVEDLQLNLGVKYIRGLKDKEVVVGVRENQYRCDLASSSNIQPLANTLLLVSVTLPTNYPLKWALF